MAQQLRTLVAGSGDTALIPTFERHRKVYLSVFEASLAYKARKPCLKEKKTNLLPYRRPEFGCQYPHGGSTIYQLQFPMI